ncbi:hypothetical protein [Enterobacter hormaechei]|uniref:hypothetical protein n=1 Tax=Enterobacter hormaechei TaxID=158836 RepID=UPI0039C70AD3|nr:hypothetical protein [Enterobacter hormaechei subsp. steigerwaltii]
MTSKNRITVNFKKEPFRLLESLAREHGPSLAGLTQSIVTAAVRNNVADKLYLEKLRSSAALMKYSDKENDDTGKILLQTSKRDEYGNENIVLRACPVKLGDYISQPVFLSERDAAVILKERVRECLKEHIKNCIPAVVGQLGGTPDMLHLFVKRANVRCDKTQKDFWSIRITPELHVIPVFNNDLHRSRLDFLNIRYRNFRDVAVKGWDNQKYEKMLLIDTASRSRSGGYFIGVSWSDIDYLSYGYEDFLPKEISFSRGKKELLCQIHIHNRDVSVKVFNESGDKILCR